MAASPFHFGRLLPTAPLCNLSGNQNPHGTRSEAMFCQLEPTPKPTSLELVDAKIIRSTPRRCQSNSSKGSSSSTRVTSWRITGSGGSRSSDLRLQVGELQRRASRRPLSVLIGV